ncbi:MAG: caspase family protein [Pseudomonadota bacterium]
MPSIASIICKQSKWIVLALIVVLLAACGGGSEPNCCVSEPDSAPMMTPPSQNPVEPPALTPTAEPGWFAFGASEKMIVGHPIRFSAVITAKSFDEDGDIAFTTAIASGSVPELDEIEITDTMRVRLEGQNFKFQPVATPSHPIGENETSVWKWEVTALKEGRHAIKAKVLIGYEDENGILRWKNSHTTIKYIVVSTYESAKNQHSSGSGLPESCEYRNVQNSPKRTALLLSNGAYNEDVGPLSKVYEDADNMIQALERTDFQILHCNDLSRSEIGDALVFWHDEATNLKPETTLLFYTGHGANIDGSNKVIGINAKSANPDDLAQASFSHDDLMNFVAGINADMNLLFFDACRNELLSTNNKFVSRLGNWKNVTSAEGYSGYATQFSTPSKDNGYFAAALSREIVKENVEITSIFREVRKWVEDQTKEQKPVFKIDSGTEFYFSISEN